MLYLLDANTLINAKRDYYQFNRVPEFWNWLVHQGELGNIKIPIEIYEEFKDTKDKDGRKDELAEWAERLDVKSSLLLNEEPKAEFVSKVLYEGYTSNPTDEDLEKVGKDPFLIAYALVFQEERCVVTAEVSKPKRKGANRHVPDVCDSFGIKHCNIFRLISDLDFKTNWKK